MPRFRCLPLAVVGLILAFGDGRAGGAPPTGARASTRGGVIPPAPPGLEVRPCLLAGNWSLQFYSARPDSPVQVRYRLADDAGDAVWRTADQNLWAELGKLTPGRHRIEIEVLDAAGAKKRTYTFWLDPDEELLHLAKDYLAMSYHWIGFSYHEGRKHANLVFGTPVSYRDALREVRWSLDSCALDRRFPLGPPAPPGVYELPRRIDHDQKLGENVPKEAVFACQQLVYRDGETSEPRLSYHHRPPAAASAVTALAPAPVPPPAAARASASGSSPVSLRPMRSNSGWLLTFEIPARHAVREIRYRLDPGTEWRSTGQSSEINLDRQERMPRVSVAVDPIWVTPGRHRIDVELVDWSGAKSGPFTLWFDPEAEILAQAKQCALGHRCKWVQLREYKGRLLAYFDLSFKDTLREIRYSFGGCALDRRFPFDSWTDLAEPPRITEQNDLEMPGDASSICVQLVFRDGEATAARRFDLAGEESP